MSTQIERARKIADDLYDGRHCKQKIPRNCLERKEKNTGH